MARTPAAPATHVQGRSGQPVDRFDRVARSGRVGVHRVTIRPRYVWQYLIAGLLGFALLTTAGIFAVQAVGSVDSLSIVGRNSGAQATKDPSTAELDKSATVVILNGTATPNLAGALGDIITKNEWGQVVYSAGTEEPDVKISAVFYRDPADAAAAAGLAAQLGGISTYVTEDYADYDARLIVLIGEDYAGPGIEEAKAMPTETLTPPSSADESVTDPNTGLPVDPNTEQPIQ